MHALMASSLASGARCLQCFARRCYLCFTLSESAAGRHARADGLVICLGCALLDFGFYFVLFCFVSGVVSVLVLCCLRRVQLGPPCVHSWHGRWPRLIYGCCSFYLALIYVVVVLQGCSWAALHAVMASSLASGSRCSVCLPACVLFLQHAQLCRHARCGAGVLCTYPVAYPDTVRRLSACRCFCLAACTFFWAHLGPQSPNPHTHPTPACSRPHRDRRPSCHPGGQPDVRIPLPAPARATS